jgi:uncharacterized membrane protein
MTAELSPNPVLRMTSALALCLGITVLVRIAAFVIAQSRSVFRFLFFWHPVVLLPFLPGGIVAGAIFVLATRKSGRPHLLLSLSVLVVSLALGWAIAHEPLKSWVLPPADVK